MRPVLEVLGHSSDQLLRSVERLDRAQWAEPTGLPGWTRAHLVAHLALNAEGLGGAVRGVIDGAPVPMYASNPRRDADIEELAAASPDRIRERLAAATALIQAALEDLSEEQSEQTFERTPGAQRIRAGRVPLMRLREVEIHHSDLGVGYSPGDWSGEAALLLLELGVRRPGLPPMTVEATDLARTWTVAEGGPTVCGPAGELVWWLSGRATDRLTPTAGLPPIPPF